MFVLIKVKRNSLREIHSSCRWYKMFNSTSLLIYTVVLDNLYNWNFCFNFIVICILCEALLSAFFYHKWIKIQCHLTNRTLRTCLSAVKETWMSPFQPKIKAYSGNAKWRSRVFPRIFPQLKWRHSCFYHSTERHVSHVLFVNYKKDRINTKMKLKDTTKPFAEFSNLNTPLSFRYGRGRYCVLLCIVYFSPNLILTFY